MIASELSLRARKAWRSHRLWTRRARRSLGRADSPSRIASVGW